MKANSGNPCDIIIRDNQDFVGTNMYTESTTSFLSVSGDGAYPGQPGHVSVQGTECRTFSPQAITINDYEGRVTATGMQFDSMTDRDPTHTITQTGTRPTDLVLLGNMFWSSGPTLTEDSGGQLSILANIVADNTYGKICLNVPNQLPGLSAASVTTLLQGGMTAAAVSSQAGPLADAAAALDDFRLLGEVDLAINHP